MVKFLKITANSSSTLSANEYRCLPIASLVTPATLSVELIPRKSSVMADVPLLHISDANQAHRYAYTFPSHNKTDPKSQTFMRPRTVLTRLAVAAATSAQVLRITPPFANASYRVQFFGPIVKCGDANMTVARQIQNVAQRDKISEDGLIVEVTNSYFAMVPDLSTPATLSRPGVIQAANHSDSNGAARGSNQLWIRFPRYDNRSSGGLISRPHFLQCELYNTSYEVGFSFVQGAQSLKVNDLKPLNAVPYPDRPSDTDNAQMQMAYTAFMWVLSDQLTGSIGFYKNVTTTAVDSSSKDDESIFSEISTNIQQTALLGSSDLQSFFDTNHQLFPSKKGTESGKVSDQRMQDILLAKNRTLDVLIEELSCNMTLSLLSNNLLS